jgi:hypothetical protein
MAGQARISAYQVPHRAACIPRTEVETCRPEWRRIHRTLGRCVERRTSDLWGSSTGDWEAEHDLQYW